MRASCFVAGDNDEHYRLSTLNYLIGTVIRIRHDGVASEVIIQLPSGEAIAVTITQISAEALVLQRGNTVSAVLKSNAVMSGL